MNEPKITVEIGTMQENQKLAKKFVEIKNIGKDSLSIETVGAPFCYDDDVFIKKVYQIKFVVHGATALELSHLLDRKLKSLRITTPEYVMRVTKTKLSSKVAIGKPITIISVTANVRIINGKPAINITNK